MPTRRAFLRASAATAASSALLTAALPWSRLLGGGTPGDEPFTFDLHLHPGLFIQRGTPQYLGDDAVRGTLRAMRAGGVHAGFVSLVGDGPLIQLGANGVSVTGAYRPGEAQAEFARQLATVRELLPQAGARVVTTLAQARTAIGEGQVAAFLSCEGSEFLDGDPGRVEPLWEQGIRSIQLVHYVPNLAGDLQTQPAQHHGLSAFGREVVRRMSARRMLVDVAHASMETVVDVVRATDAPVILSHSILKIDDRRPLNARAITPAHATLVAKTGGVIGAWPSATNARFAEFVENTKRLADVVGVEHVGLGTDMDGNLRPVLATYGQFADWTAALASHGFTAREVAQMAGENMARVIRQVIG
ncbi:MAG: hypothetical protein RLZ32_1520 [Gemmatimonadota bacterium]